MERTAALGTLGFIVGAVIVVYLNGPLHLLPDSLSRAVAALTRGRPSNASAFTDETPEVEPEKSLWQREWEGLGRGLMHLAWANARMREAQLREAERVSSAPAKTQPPDTEDLDRSHPKPDRLKRDVSPLAETRPREQAPTPVTPPPTAQATVTQPTAETGSSLAVRVAEVRVGAEVVALGIVPEATLNQHAKSGKYLVYFELALTNTAAADARQVRFRDFQLQDRQGLLYSPLEPAGTPSAELPPGQTRRSGVVFAVYDDSAPARLLYQTAAGAYIPLSLSGPVIVPGTK